MKYSFFWLIIALVIVSCQKTGDITSSDALSLVEEYVENNPIFETGKFNTDKIKLTTNKDEKLIESLENLEDDGYIKISDEKKRKKWFSKDSVYIITPVLTEKSLPFVVKQNRNSTEVKTLFYKVDESQDVTFEKKTDKVATFNVILLKDKSPFYEFGKDENPNSDFITRKFKAKYKKEIGWVLVQ